MNNYCRIIPTFITRSRHLVMPSDSDFKTHERDSHPKGILRHVHNCNYLLHRTFQTSTSLTNNSKPLPTKSVTRCNDKEVH